MFLALTSIHSSVGYFASLSHLFAPLTGLSAPQALGGRLGPALQFLECLRAEDSRVCHWVGVAGSLLFGAGDRCGPEAQTGGLNGATSSPLLCSRKGLSPSDGPAPRPFSSWTPLHGGPSPASPNSPSPLLSFCTGFGVCGVPYGLLVQRLAQFWGSWALTYGGR